MIYDRANLYVVNSAHKFFSSCFDEKMETEKNLFSVLQNWVQH